MLDNQTHGIEDTKGTLMNLMKRVQNQASRQLDLGVSTPQMQYQIGEKGQASLILEASGGEPTRIFDVNEHCNGQIASSTGFDSRTFARLRYQYPEELSNLVNKIFMTEKKKHTLRAFAQDNGLNRHMARALVSNKFKLFDNHHLLQAVLEPLMESIANWTIVHGDITDKRMYIQFRSRDIEGSGATVNDIMASGIGLSNSEVGAGSVQCYQIVWTLACLNGQQTTNKTRKAHITSAREDSGTWELLTEEAKDADNTALILQLRDLTKAYASREMFDEVIEKMRLAHENKINGTAQEAVENLGKVINLTKKETSNVLDGLMATIGQAGYAGEKVSQATMVNAVTAVSHMADIDNRSDWQRRGSQVLDLSPSDWQRVAC